MTTATGTVALYFLPDGGSTLRVQKQGFRATTFDVAIPAKDTVPITLTLIRGN